MILWNFLTKWYVYICTTLFGASISTTAYNKFGITHEMMLGMSIFLNCVLISICIILGIKLLKAIRK